MLNMKSFAIVAVGLVGLSSVAAFNALEATNRAVDLTVVSDDAAGAYLQIVNQDARYSSFVSTDPTSGLTSVTLSNLNPSATFYYDAILKVVNQGAMDLCVTVQPAGTNVAVTEVAFKSANATWLNTDYAVAGDSQSLVAGAGVGYVGLKIVTSTKDVSHAGEEIVISAVRGLCA